MRRFGIELQTVFGMPPVEHVALAADVGCAYISTGLTPVPWKLERFPAWSLRDDAALRREMRAAMTDQDVIISLAEGFAIRPQTNARDHAADLDIMAELGAQRAGAVSMEPDQSRSMDELAILADLTAERNMGFSLEFALPHTYNNLHSAMSAIRQLGKPNVKVLIDAMHFFRSGGTIAELEDADPELLGYVQLCDVRLEGDGQDYYHEACYERMCPGDGELPLLDLLRALPSDIPLGLEVPMLSEVERNPDIKPVIKRIVEASRQLVGRL